MDVVEGWLLLRLKMGPKIGGHYRQVVVRLKYIMFMTFYGVTGSVSRKNNIFTQIIKKQCFIALKQQLKWIKELIRYY